MDNGGTHVCEASCMYVYDNMYIYICIICMYACTGVHHTYI
jgi:hypothetical protein